MYGGPDAGDDDGTALVSFGTIAVLAALAAASWRVIVVLKEDPAFGKCNQKTCSNDGRRLELAFTSRFGHHKG